MNESRQKLVEENINLVYFLVNKYYPTFIGDEDIIQCGMIGLCKAGDIWDESKSKFSTYASKCILNEINMEFRRRKKDSKNLSLDKEVADDSGEYTTFGDLLIGDENVEYFDAEYFYSRLGETGEKVLRLYRAGLSPSQIGDQLGCGANHVRSYLRKIQMLWRDCIGDYSKISR